MVRGAGLNVSEYISVAARRNPGSAGPRRREPCGARYCTGCPAPAKAVCREAAVNQRWYRVYSPSVRVRTGVFYIFGRI